MTVTVASAAQVLIWALVGIGMTAGHLFMLHRALAKVGSWESERAGQSLSKGLLLRLLVLSPILLLAARSGLAACIGLVLGYGAGRWAILYYVGTDRRFSMSSSKKQG